MTEPTPITVAYGDGIGPEIMQATLQMLDAAGATIAPDVIEVGERTYKKGFSSGVEPESWESLRRTKIFLKAPITTPQGGGVRSLNVTIRGALGLYANVRPTVSHHPFIRTKHPHVDLVLVRENQEDVYTGIEYQQTPDVVQCLKLMSRTGSRRVIRYAFEYARAHGRKAVTCMTKDNIMKLTDGMFHQVFCEVAKEYPEIETRHLIIDIGAALVADNPEAFDVLVLPNLYGDIVSDIAAQVVGSVGMAGSANVGDAHAMFEAVHGSAPAIAGQDTANPSGLLSASLMMLRHIGQGDAATRLQNAWLVTLEDGIHTADIYDPRVSSKLVGTSGFTSAVIERLGMSPKSLRATKSERSVSTQPSSTGARQSAVGQAGQQKHATGTPSETEVLSTKALIGVDIYVQAAEEPGSFSKRVRAAAGDALSLAFVTNRGVRVWPDENPGVLCVDHWRCRFLGKTEALSYAVVIEMLQRLNEASLDIIKTENLYSFNGVRRFSSSEET